MAEVDSDTAVTTYDVALHVMCIGTGEAAGVAEILSRQLVGLGAEGQYATLSINPLTEDDLAG